MKTRIILIVLVGALLSTGCMVVPYLILKPTPTLTPTPMQRCYVDWNWGGATLEIYGPDAWSYCDGLVAYGYRDYRKMFYAHGGIYGETILCEFTGTNHYLAVWDEPAWEAGSEFCSFLGTLEQLP